MMIRTLRNTLAAKFISHPNQPLLLTGASGTGKTTLLQEIGKAFTQVIVFDMEAAADRHPFNSGEPYSEICNALFFIRNREKSVMKTLILIREIQSCPEAVSWFQQMATKGCNYSIAATTSFLSPEIMTLISYPESTISTVHVPPLTFLEFLHANHDKPALEAFLEVPVPFYAYENLLNHFHLYSLIGGMPEIVSVYMLNHDIKGLGRIYDAIFENVAIMISVQAASTKTAGLVTETFLNSFPFAATRIMFNHFGNSPRKSREIAMAFRILEQHMQLRLVYPTTSTLNSHATDRLKSPRLQLADTGMVNYFSGIQNPLFGSHDMNAIFEGQVAKQVVGQELSASETEPDLNFWIRKKLQSTAEVDFVVSYKDMVVPVVVKSGEPGRLRSLHQFVDEAPHPYAVRLSAGKVSVTQSQTIAGKKFYLLNLPYFLASKIKEHLHGFIRLASG